jgi:hypothetical protein
MREEKKLRRNDRLTRQQTTVMLVLDGLLWARPERMDYGLVCFYRLPVIFFELLLREAHNLLESELRIVDDFKYREGKSRLQSIYTSVTCVSVET